MADFKLDGSKLVRGIANCADKAQNAMLLYAQTGALKLQNHARKYAPWTDRTGHARQRLTCEMQVVDAGYLEILSHGVDYGIWLELMQDGRFSIIDPTIVEKGAEVLEGFNRLVEKL